MIRHTAFLALTILSALYFFARLEGVRADELADCEQGQEEKQIQGCSRIIESGILFGKPIGKKNLAAAHNNRGRAYGRKGAFDREGDSRLPDGSRSGPVT
ncbi:MAG TPA: hypothetical protein ENH05_05645 [Rhizobiales bacterium]|nr:hypothetical protein [Hyphomicrobiales bacterium]